MSDTPSGGQFPIPNMGGIPGMATPDPKKLDPQLKMEYDKVRSLGDGFAQRGQSMTALSSATRSIDMYWDTFGVVGYGLAAAHDEVRDKTADALGKGKDVLDSWKVAVTEAADFVQAADEASKAPPGDETPPPPGDGGPNLPKGVKGPKLDGLPTDVPGPELGGLGDQSKVPGLDSKLPDPSDIKSPGDLKNPDLTTPKPRDLDPLNPRDLDPLNPRDLDPLNPRDPRDLDRPDLDTGALSNPKLDNPIESKLAGYDPSLSGQDLTTRTPSLGDLGKSPMTTVDPRGVTSGGGGVGGGGIGGANGAGAPGGLGAGMRGLGGTGMPMMPFAPMAGGGTGEHDRDQQGNNGLAEDPEVWEDDIDIAPPVIGKE